MAYLLKAVGQQTDTSYISVKKHTNEPSTRYPSFCYCCTCLSLSLEPANFYCLYFPFLKVNASHQVVCVETVYTEKRKVKLVTSLCDSLSCRVPREYCEGLHVLLAGRSISEQRSLLQVSSQSLLCSSQLARVPLRALGLISSTCSSELQLTSSLLPFIRPQDIHQA